MLRPSQFHQLTEMAALPYFLYDGATERLYLSRHAQAMLWDTQPAADAPELAEVSPASLQEILFRRSARLLTATMARQAKGAAPGRASPAERCTTLMHNQDLLHWEFCRSPEYPEQLIGLLHIEGRHNALQNWLRRTDPARSQPEEEEDIRLLDMVLNTITDGFFAFDNKLRLMLSNEKTERMLGLKLEKRFGMSLYEMRENSPDKAFVEAYIEAFETGETRTLEGFSQRVQRYVRIIAYPSASGLVVFVQDIDQKKQNEARLQEALRQKNALLAEVHHRVKNNLAIIQSLLAFQQESITHGEERRHFEAAQMRIHAIALVHELLYKHEDFSAIKAYEYMHRLADFLHKQLAPEKPVVKQHLDINLDAELHITKAISFGILLYELLSNCYRHAFANSKAEPGHLYIELWAHGEQHLLCVQDNGPGCTLYSGNLPAQQLGLTLAENMALQLGGELHFKNAEEGGLCVSCLFPPLSLSL